MERYRTQISNTWVSSWNTVSIETKTINISVIENDGVVETKSVFQMPHPQDKRKDGAMSPLGTCLQEGENRVRNRKRGHVEFSCNSSKRELQGMSNSCSIDGQNVEVFVPWPIMACNGCSIYLLIEHYWKSDGLTSGNWANKSQLIYCNHTRVHAPCPICSQWVI